MVTCEDGGSSEIIIIILKKKWMLSDGLKKN